MCYNLETSIASFLSALIAGIVALALKLPILGCLILSYGLMQLSEIMIWRGIDTKDDNLNKIGTMIGKYSLPNHNLAIGIGVLISYWAVKKNPKYWIPLIVGVAFYIGVLVLYATKKDTNGGVTKACRYPEEKDNCTKESARLEWPYPHSWYPISFVISIALMFLFVRPIMPVAVLLFIFFAGTFMGVLSVGKNSVFGSYWCWSTAAFAPILVLLTYFLVKPTKVGVHI